MQADILNFNKRDSRRRSYTLIELIMVIVIVGTLTGVSSMYIKESIDLWKFLSFRNEVVSRARMALARMLREIRQTKDKVSIQAANQAQFQFDDINGNNITFQLTGSSLMRNSDVLADNVQSLKFCYYDINHSPACSPVCECNVSSGGLQDICLVGIQIVTASGDQTKSLSSQIFLRNFQ